MSAVSVAMSRITVVSGVVPGEGRSGPSAPSPSSRRLGVPHPEYPLARPHRSHDMAERTTEKLDRSGEPTIAPAGDPRRHPRRRGRRRSGGSGLAGLTAALTAARAGAPRRACSTPVAAVAGPGPRPWSPASCSTAGHGRCTATGPLPVSSQRSVSAGTGAAPATRRSRVRVGAGHAPDAGQRVAAAAQWRSRRTGDRPDRRGSWARSRATRPISGGRAQRHGLGRAASGCPPMPSDPAGAGAPGHLRR